MSSLKFISRLIFVLITIQGTGYCQSSITCKDLKTGKFYAYSRTSADRFLYIRSGELQKSINLTTADTAVWGINWLDDCTYSLNFIGGGKSERAFYAMYKKHKIVVQAYSVTNNYFLYKVYLDKVSDIIIDADTMWLKEKAVDDRTDNTKDFAEASFAGGNDAWKNYITGVITKNIGALTRANIEGTCYIGFIVNADGSISQVEALTLEDTKMAKVATKAIIKGPKWKPALMQGKPVGTYFIQPVTFRLE